MKLFEIRDILKAEVIVGADQMDKTIIGACGADLMGDVLAAVAKESILLSGFTTQEVIRTAKIADVAAVVFVRGKQPEKSTVELARSYHLPIMLTRYSLFVACGRLYMNGLRGLDGSW
ncbi:MAG: hypothetical protein BWK80_24525 [Desulfobacteraceae bacterium IS3]|nr:MAG: hypothetical protein BWK80_24525 [Desulfobacteraceae bacterium IS3]